MVTKEQKTLISNFFQINLHDNLNIPFSEHDIEYINKDSDYMDDYGALENTKLKEDCVHVHLMSKGDRENFSKNIHELVAKLTNQYEISSVIIDINMYFEDLGLNENYAHIYFLELDEYRDDI